ncbi:MAG: hypothetical protein V4721_00495 [Bacteroidota bacterium]
MLLFLKPYYLVLAKWIGILITVILVIFRLKTIGRQEERGDNLEAAIKGVKTRDEIKNNIISADDMERKRLRKKWNRD